MMKLRFGLLPDGPRVQKPSPTPSRSSRHTPSLPIRSPATSTKVSRSPPAPQKQKTRRVRRARSTPDSIDAPRARLRLTSIPTPQTRALRSMLSLFVSIAMTPCYWISREKHCVDPRFRLHSCGLYGAGWLLSRVGPGCSGGEYGAAFRPGRLGRAAADFQGFPVRGAEKGQKGRKRASLGEMGRS